MERIEIRSKGEQVSVEGSKICGYASVFYNPTDPGTEYNLFDNVYERIDRAAFNRALSEKRDVTANFNHDNNYLLGRTSSGTLRLSVDSRGLFYEVKLDESDPQHQSIKAKVARGDITGSSFKFKLVQENWSRKKW